MAEQFTMLGELPPTETAQKLREIGDDEAAELYEQQAASTTQYIQEGLFSLRRRPDTQHQYSFIPHNLSTSVSPICKPCKETWYLPGKRWKNTPVQKFRLGLDFEEGTPGASLAIGSYIVAPQFSWRKNHSEHGIRAHREKLKDLSS